MKYFIFILTLMCGGTFLYSQDDVISVSTGVEGWVWDSQLDKYVAVNVTLFIHSEFGKPESRYRRMIYFHFSGPGQEVLFGS